MPELMSSLTQIQRSFLVCLLMAFLLGNVVDSFSLNSGKMNKKENSNHAMVRGGKWKYRKEDGAYFPVIDGAPSGLLARVAFSRSSKPTLSPSQGSLLNKHILDRDTAESIHLERRISKRSVRKNKKGRKRRHRHGKKKNRKSRRRRSHGNGRVRSQRPVSACNSVSEWVQLNQSVTTWGHTVTVLPYMWIDDNRIDQYIYQTECLDSNQPCTGIDNRLFRSECVTKKIYSYAFVRNAVGDESWTTIEVKGSCNCKLFPKHRPGPRNILDHLAIRSDD